MKGTADIVAYFSRTALLNPKRELHDGSLQSELVLVNFEE
ncbi:hypothetical protein EMIT0P258_30154 [Pseudomonas sp. IT-P258]